MPDNLFLALQRNADADPRGGFLRSADSVVTNAEALLLTKQIAFELRRLGLRAHEVVALDLPDQLAVLFTEALYHEGAIPTVLPEGYDPTGVFDIHWVVTSRAGSPGAPVIADAQIVEVDARFLRRIEENPSGISPTDDCPDTIRIVFSSGTTGTPRAIELSRRALRSFDDALDTWFQGDPFLVLMDFRTPWGFGGFHLAVDGGRPFLSSGGADQAALVRLAADNAVTSLKGSPAQIAALVEQLEKEGRTLPAVETVFVGGTVMPPGVADRVRRATEGCVIHSMYGSTEATIGTSRVYDSDDPSDAGSVLPGSTIEIVDDEDRPLPIGERGRVRHRSEGMAFSYLGDAEASARAFRDGWFYSGDLGFFRADGGLTLTGRETEVLNAGGVKIDPVRLDHAALAHPGVKDACAFDYATESGVRGIGLAIVLDDAVARDADADVTELVRSLAREFSSAAPTLVVRVADIPRNAMGKPLRRVLAAQHGES
ncbi:class I adenylate-forming enzyme family protein [Schumannella soli]|uniref:Long-chain fatty acid--CoA ligase n=1 Tax=Schumannella soli TaxID=2590779 RepID=A0A506XWS9_9MICO|nr:fatty acid--CoA ligase family protein [Schumannella soli]TPW74265.1 long-chain fatty acid--CoA ligase [Schumannella soli]